MATKPKGLAKIWREIKKSFRKIFWKSKFEFFSRRRRYEAVQKMSLKDKQDYLSHHFKDHVGYEINWEYPKSFNEKIQWLKLFYHDPLITKCSDKYLVRDYVKEKVGEKHLVPLLGVWKNENEIDFDSLPDKFVLKVNWGSGQNIICKDKANLDIHKTRKKLNKWLLPASNHYYCWLEQGYKDIEPRIICEEYIEQGNGNLLDYKFFCYNGDPKNLFVVSDRNTNLGIKLDFFDSNWAFLPFTRLYPNSGRKIEKPKKFYEMLNISKILSQPFPFVRVDFFELDEKLYVGELTFFPGCGHEAFTPTEWDYKLGEMLKLPLKKNPL